MANVVFGWPIYSDVGVTYTPTLSGGSWSSALPLTNLQDRRLAKVARSTNALAASTQFEIDLKTARAIRVIGIPKHTISASGTVRVRGYTGAGGTGSLVYDSTALAAWPVGITAETSQGMNLGWVHVPTAAQTARYWIVEITDTTNPAGYVDVARICLCAGWQPTNNMLIGVKQGLETDTTRTVTDGGAAIYNAKAVRRTVALTLAPLDESEALASGFDMQRIAGTSGQLYFVFDPTDTTQMHRRSMLCVLKELSPMEYVFANLNSLPFTLIEEL